VIEIPLAGKYSHLSVKIDDEDFGAVSQYRWLHSRNGKVVYARRTFDQDGTRKQQLLHSFLTGWPLVDHINHDGLDNRRVNLRPASRRENILNSRKPATRDGLVCASSYKGVARKRNKWRAYIAVEGKQLNLGVYTLELDAALAFDRAARQHHGEFACLNFPE
jgi:hypothetical protein